MHRYLKDLIVDVSYSSALIIFLVETKDFNIWEQKDNLPYQFDFFELILV